MKGLKSRSYYKLLILARNLPVIYMSGRAFLLFLTLVIIGLICVEVFSKVSLAIQQINIEKRTVEHLKDSIRADWTDTNIKLFDEKITSINKRFDDLYILGGTVVVLIISINIGIFVRTEDEVNKQLKEYKSSLDDTFKKYTTKTIDEINREEPIVAQQQPNPPPPH